MSLAVVAGQGFLPRLVLDHLETSGRPYFLCELEGFPFVDRTGQPLIRFRIETLGSFIAELLDRGVDEICFAGQVGRPKLDPAAIDSATMPLVPRMMQALQAGDDAALRLLLSFFNERGIVPVGAHDLRPDLLPEPGILGEIEPHEQHKSDAQRGVEIIAAMGAADVGQSCIVAGGQALAIEAMPGTDWMMQSLLTQAEPLRADLTAAFLGRGPSRRGPGVADGGILVKAAKPGQELRVDMPVIGPDTIRRAAQVGLQGIVIEAGRVMIIDTPLCVSLADRAGLFLWVMK